jgi:predicted AAA+ superfamily ATPase
VQKGGFPGVIDLDPWRAQEELGDILDKGLFKDVAALMGKREPLVYYLAKYPGSILVAERVSSALGIQPIISGYSTGGQGITRLISSSQRP